VAIKDKYHIIVLAVQPTNENSHIHMLHVDMILYVGIMIYVGIMLYVGIILYVVALYYSITNFQKPHDY
jgi:hypothetical protein